MIYLAGSLLALVALGAGAALAEEVVLNSKEDGVELRGELISFEDGIYRVETVIGEIAIAADVVECSGPGCPDLAPAEPELIARPGEAVTIITENDSVRLNGTLISFENGAYEIETNIGRLEILAEGTRCEGPGCPVPNIAEGAIDVVATPATAEIPASEGTSSALPLPAFTDFDVAIAQMTADPEVEIAGAASVIELLLPTVLKDLSSDASVDVALAETTPLDFNSASAMGAPAGSLGFELPGGEDAASGIIAKLGSGGETADDADILFMTGSIGDASVDPGLRPVGIEPLVAIVSKTNPVFALSREQLAEIFSGVVENWSDVGGQDRTIRVVGLAPPHDLTNAALQQVTAPFGRSLLIDIDRLSSTAEMVEAVAQDDAAIGFVNLSQIGDAKTLGVLDSCNHPVTASASAVKSGRYPFARTVLADIRNSDGLAGNVVASLDAIAADPARAGLLPLGVVSHTLDDEIGRLRDGLNAISDRAARQNASNALRMMGLVEKLNLSFTFDPGSNRLSGTADDVADAVLDYAEEAGLDEVFLVGFSEDTGLADRNKDISRTAAKLASSALTSADGSNALETTVVRTIGLGAISPLACDDTDKFENRRVEIWLRR